MQDVGSKEDMELSREDLTLSWRELSVESLEHCQSVGNWMSFPAWCVETENLSLFPSLEKHPVSRVSVD
jgi:hypothetical protein